MGKRFIMTEKQTQRFIEIYPDTPKEEIMAWLGVSRSTVMKAAKRLGLRKSKEFINAENKKNGFKKGITSAMRIGVEREEERRKRANATRNATIAKEKIRAKWGMQQTKLRLCGVSRKRLGDRYLLKRAGYILDEEKMVAYYDKNTKRLLKSEKTKRVVYSFAPIEEMDSENSILIHDSYLVGN